MKKLRMVAIYFSFCLSSYSEEAFKVVVLGCEGGPFESNTSCYLIAPQDSSDFIALDAGTLLHGIYLAEKNNCFNEIEMDLKTAFRKEVEILRKHIKGYLISHAHLDHIAGLVLNSTEDVSKPIFGIDSVINFLRDYIFNGKIWPNFGSEGNVPQIGQYLYKRVELGKEIEIPNTKMKLESYLLSHPDGYESTAFLIESSGSYLVYFGDTVPDCLSSKKQMNLVWKRLAPLILEKKLKAIFLECSYLDKPDDQLFGHLDAKHMIKELHHFAKLVDPLHPDSALKGLKILVTHIKNPLLKKEMYKKEIMETLEKANDLGVEFLFPFQGERINL